MRARWAAGLATIISIKGTIITIRCPHCDQTHQHGRSTIGSRAVVAGCHTGYTRLREYRIPEADPPHRKRRAPTA